MPRAHVGMAGWVYPPWRGTFYPAGLRHAEELSFAASRVTSIEINSSFYRTPTRDSWLAWRDTVPDEFVFSVKAPRSVTVARRLRDVADLVERFLDSGVRELGPKLGPILWQTPTDLPFDATTVASFLTVLSDTGMRHALEVRHPSFDVPEFRACAAAAGVAVVLGDTGNGWPVLDWPIADFAYARLHGDIDRYPDGYDSTGIRRWADWTREQLAAGRDAYLYCVTENKVHSPRDAESLVAALAD